MNLFIRYTILLVILGWPLATGFSQADSAAVEAQIRTAGQLRFTAIDSALEVARLAQQGAEALSEPRVLAKAEYQLGVVFSDLGELDSALVHALRALKKMRQIEWAFGEILTLNIIGATYRSQSNYRQALRYLQESYFKAQEVQDSVSMAYALNNMGNVYFDAQEDEEAQEYYERGLAIARLVREEDPYILTNLLTNLSNVVEPERRYHLLLEAEASARGIGDSSTLVFVWNNLAGYHVAIDEQSDSVYYYYDKSFTAAQTVGDSPSMVAAANGLAEWYITTGKPRAAKNWVDWGLDQSRTHGNLTAQSEAHQNAANWYRQVGQTSQALLHQDTFIALLEAAYEEEKTEALANAYQRYAVAEKDLELAQKDLALSQERSRRLRLWGLLLCLLVVAILLLLWLRARAENARKSAELQTQQARYWQELHNYKTRLFADISHDLRHPLSLIVGPVRQLQQQVRDLPSQGFLQLIADSANTMLARINSLLDLARLEAGQLPLRPRPVELLPFLRRTILAYESLAESLTIKIDFQYQLADQLVVNLDVDKVEKVLQNLMSNALKYGPVDSTVYFQAQQESGQLVLMIADEGQGISEEQYALIFQRFGQRDDTKPQSTGIGLALSRQLARRLGGELELLSRAPQGAKLQLVLPLEEVELPTTEIGKEPLPVDAVVLPAELPQGYLLLVEDQEDMRHYLEQLLRPHYRVWSATNGTEALQVLQKNRVDLILSDVGMPGMDGLSFREKVKAHQRWAKLPFVFLTARALEEQQLLGLTLGVDDYLLKPFLPEELLVRLQNLYRNTLGRQGAAEENSRVEAVDDIQFRELHQIAVAHLSQSAFNVQMWSEAAGMSARKLRRIVQQHSNLNAVQYLLELRLQKAYQLINRRTHFTVAEVAYDCGIESLSYFSRKFQTRFGIKASELLRAGG